MKDLQRRPGPDLSLHQPRPGGGLSHLRLCRRHVPGPAGRVGRGPSPSSSSPQHPYTRMLLDAIPDLEMSWARAHSRRGRGAQPDRRRPSGCHFHPRCPLRQRSLPRQESPRAACAPKAARSPATRSEEGRLTAYARQGRGGRIPVSDRTRPSMPIINRIAEFQDDMTAWRRGHPQASRDWPSKNRRTAEIVAEKLAELGLSRCISGIAKTGVVGVLQGNGGSGEPHDRPARRHGRPAHGPSSTPTTTAR